LREKLSANLRGGLRAALTGLFVFATFLTICNYVFFPATTGASELTILAPDDGYNLARLSILAFVLTAAGSLFYPRASSRPLVVGLAAGLAFLAFDSGDIWEQVRGLAGSIPKLRSEALATLTKEEAEEWGRLAYAVVLEQVRLYWVYYLVYVFWTVVILYSGYLGHWCLRLLVLGREGEEREGALYVAERAGYGILAGILSGCAAILLASFLSSLVAPGRVGPRPAEGLEDLRRGRAPAGVPRQSDRGESAARAARLQRELEMFLRTLPGEENELAEIVRAFSAELAELESRMRARGRPAPPGALGGAGQPRQETEEVARQAREVQRELRMLLSMLPPEEKGLAGTFEGVERDLARLEEEMAGPGEPAGARVLSSLDRNRAYAAVVFLSFFTCGYVTALLVRPRTSTWVAWGAVVGAMTSPAAAALSATPLGAAELFGQLDLSPFALGGIAIGAALTGDWLGNVLLLYARKRQHFPVFKSL